MSATPMLRPEPPTLTPPTGDAPGTNRFKSLIVALTRFSGIVSLLNGAIAVTYVGPYHHYMIVRENTATYTEAALGFWLAILQVILRLLMGLLLVTQAGTIIDALRPSKGNAGPKAPIVAFVRLHGFVLLFSGVAFAVNPDHFVFNLFNYGLPALPSAARGMLRVGLYLVAGLIVVMYAEKIIDWLEQQRTHNPPENQPPRHP